MKKKQTPPFIRHLPLTVAQFGKPWTSPATKKFKLALLNLSKPTQRTVTSNKTWSLIIHNWLVWFCAGNFSHCSLPFSSRSPTSSSASSCAFRTFFPRSPRISPSYLKSYQCFNCNKMNNCIHFEYKLFSRQPVL